MRYWIRMPHMVTEGSDYKTGINGLAPKCLPHVIVNGQFVKRDNKATDVMADQPIRFPDQVSNTGNTRPSALETGLGESFPGRIQADVKEYKNLKNELHQLFAMRY